MEESRSDHTIFSFSYVNKADRLWTHAVWLCAHKMTLDTIAMAMQLTYCDLGPPGQGVYHL
jgi:hypothetical protein